MGDTPFTLTEEVLFHFGAGLGPKFVLNLETQFELLRIADAPLFSLVRSNKVTSSPCPLIGYKLEVERYLK